MTTLMPKTQALEFFEMIRSLRDELFEVLTDEDLAYALPGSNPTLGGLCRELGEVQHSYIESFKTETFDLDYQYADASVETDIAALRAWFASLDEALMSVVGGMSEEDMRTKIISRPGFEVTAIAQFMIFREGLFIFCGKVTCYLKAMEKPMPGRWPLWIG
jgi:uncharacterized damage-inducible protein DinB